MHATLPTVIIKMKGLAIATAEGLKYIKVSFGEYDHSEKDPQDYVMIGYIIFNCGTNCERTYVTANVYAANGNTSAPSGRSGTRRTKTPSAGRRTAGNAVISRKKEKEMLKIKGWIRGGICWINVLTLVTPTTETADASDANGREERMVTLDSLETMTTFLFRCHDVGLSDHATTNLRAESRRHTPGGVSRNKYAAGPRRSWQPAAAGRETGRRKKRRRTMGKFIEVYSSDQQEHPNTTVERDTTIFITTLITMNLGVLWPPPRRGLNSSSSSARETQQAEKGGAVEGPLIGRPTHAALSHTPDSYAMINCATTRLERQSRCDHRTPGARKCWIKGGARLSNKEPTSTRLARTLKHRLNGGLERQVIAASMRDRCSTVLAIPFSILKRKWLCNLLIVL